MTPKKLENRFRNAGLLLVFGLISLLLTLMWEHPVSFLVCIGVGGSAVFLGVSIYLHTIVTLRSADPKPIPNEDENATH